MRQWPQRLLLGVAMALSAAGCKDASNECGADQVETPGVVVEGDTSSVATEFIGFSSSPNNDCTPPGATVTSLTLQAQSTDQSSPFILVFCLPRPDQIGDQELVVTFEGNEDVEDPMVELVTLSGAVDEECNYTLDRDVALDVTASFVGYCDQGASASGFALTLTGNFSLLRSSCDDQSPPESIGVTISGTAAVFPVLD